MSPLDYSRASRVLRRDPIMAALIRAHGPCGPGDALRVDHLSALVRAIIFQQLSTRAASTIHGRFLGLLPGGQISAAALAALTDEQFRSVGISRQKALYLRDLAGKINSHAVTLDHLEEMNDEAVITTLSAVKGIGRWTAEMFLMFRLHRPDVLPVGDLGIVTAVQKAYGLRKRPTPGPPAETGASLEAVSKHRVLVSVAESRQRGRGRVSTRCEVPQLAWVLVRDSGQAPGFDHTSTRVYVREVRNEKNTLLSVGVPAGRTELPGRDEIEHVRSENATQFAVSPDGTAGSTTRRRSTRSARRDAGGRRSGSSGRRIKLALSSQRRCGFRLQPEDCVRMRSRCVVSRFNRTLRLP